MIGIMQKRDDIYLGCLQDFYARHRVLPSYARIGALVGLSSKSSVAALVMRLKRAGFLVTSPDNRLAPTALFFGRPRADSLLPAGFPSPAGETASDMITIDEYLVEHPSRTVLVEVKGDSMIEAGIHAGDIVVVERGGEAEVGRMVVAIMDGEFTLKFLGRDRNGFFLRPANPAFSILRPEGRLEIFGVVVGMFRRYPS